MDGLRGGHGVVVGLGTASPAGAGDEDANVPSFNRVPADARQVSARACTCGCSDWMRSTIS